MINNKKFFRVFSLGVLIFLIGGLNVSTVQATQNSESSSNEIQNFDLSHEGYEKLIEEGILSSDISFEYWVELNSKHLEEEELDSSLSTTPTINAAIVHKAGDILITNDTALAGIVGHMGIVLNSSMILHTSGWKSEPYPKIITMTEWHNRYSQTKSIRPNNATLGASAAQEAINNFGAKEIPYFISPGVTNISKTYCSELVWYSYYKAGLDFRTYDRALGAFVRPDIIAPYDYLNVTNLERNGFKFLDNVW